MSPRQCTSSGIVENVRRNFQGKETEWMISWKKHKKLNHP